MKVEEYLTRSRELGIGRGQLETEFRPDLAGVSQFMEEALVNPKASLEVQIPPIKEDLSRYGRLTRERTVAERMMLALRQCKDATRPVYLSLAKRSVSVSDLARQTALEPWQVQIAFSATRPVPEYVRLRLMPLLTDYELGLLGWRRNKTKRLQ